MPKTIEKRVAIVRMSREHEGTQFDYWKYTDPEAGWDNSATSFKVHLGLKEYARLREERW